MGEPPLLEARGLCKQLPARGAGQVGRPVSALDEVSLALDAGEVVAVVGRSGAGKSTLGRVLVGIETLDRGTVRIGGVDLASAPETTRRELRRQVQLVFQEPRAALDPLQTVASALAEPLSIHRVGCQTTDRFARIEALLVSVGLGGRHELWGRLPHELSGGECQRVLLGRALACDPRALILDEPVSALDAAVRHQVLGDLLRLRDRLGLALLLIAHDLHMVRDVADRVLVMDAGRVVEEGQTASIMARPQAAATVALLSAAGLGAGAGGREPWPSFVRWTRHCGGGPRVGRVKPRTDRERNRRRARRCV